MMTRPSPGQGISQPLILLLRYAALLAVALLAACSSGSDDPPAGTTPMTITNNGGKAQTLYIEIAATNQERGTGLSNRTELGEDRGMLFIIPVKGIGFWMKDTLIPLSVAFIGPCGEIVHIADMEPRTEQLHDTDRPYKFGLEANQGWFAKHGIGAGSKVEIPAAYRLPECV